MERETRIKMRNSDFKYSTSVMVLIIVVQLIINIGLIFGIIKVAESKNRVIENLKIENVGLREENQDIMGLWQELMVD